MDAWGRDTAAEIERVITNKGIAGALVPAPPRPEESQG
jgi:hypothetical protein